jgi:gamma-glutamylcyclotransferase (GGCT)/AIG2-like uncharacterized protein YtfP
MTQNTKLINASYSTGKALIAETFNSGFEFAHDTYNGLSAASDGKIYYVLCSELMDIAGQVYSFDPENQHIAHLGDLTEMCGEKDMKVVAQGKSHVNFYESGGRLYFSTHLGYYSIKEGTEVPGVPRGDYKPYRGGHLLAYNMKTKTGESLGIAPNGEGILTTAMDTVRGIIYGLTWPTGHLFRLDVNSREMTDLGPFTGTGESRKGDGYRVICRSIGVDPRDGTAYLTNAEGEIKRLRSGSDTVETVEGDNMRKDYFGKFEVSTAGSMAYNWRQVFWYPPENRFYGVHGNSGYLFRFDPGNESLEVLERLTSVPSRRSGMFDMFSFGYLGFTLAPDGRTICYLTGGPVYVDGQRLQGKDAIERGAARGVENLHLITYDIPTSVYCDHGAVFYPDGQRPLYVNSIALGEDGTIYTLARITENDHTRTDLVRIPAIKKQGPPSQSGQFPGPGP